MAFQRIMLQFNFDGPILELPDVFVYLMGGDKSYCYMRLSSSDRQINDSRYDDFKLHVDMCSNDSGNYYEAGFINMRIAMNTEVDWQTVKRTAPDTSRDGNAVPWSKEPNLNKSGVRNVQILANVYMGRNLISADDDGLCDPMLNFYHHGSQANSSVYMDSLNPVWNERVLINSKAFDDWMPPVIVKAYDQDERIFRKDDYECLGMSKVPISITDIKVNGDVNHIADFQWHIIKDNTKLNTANVLMSFTILQNDGGLNPLNIRSMYFPKDSYLIKLHILGLRNLQSPGMFNVKNPYIKFHTGALKNSGNAKGGSAFDILTAKCKKGGPNASFSELMT